MSIEHDALSGWGSNLSPGVSTYQKIISNNYNAHDEQKKGAGKKGSTVSSINCDHCLHIDQQRQGCLPRRRELK